MYLPSWELHLTTADRRRWEPAGNHCSPVSWAVKSEVHDAQGGDAAVSEIVAGIAALRGPKGLEDLVVDLARTLADLIERIAAAEGLAAADVADALFFGEGSRLRYRRALAGSERSPRARWPG